MLRTVKLLSIAVPVLLLVTLSLIAADIVVSERRTSVQLPDAPRFDGHRAVLITRPARPSFGHHTAESAVLLDLDSGEQLYSRNSSAEHIAASLAKLVTMYVILEAAEDGRIGLDERFEPHPSSWWTEMPAGSSLMFLGADQRVSWDSLLAGLAVASGNDAAVAAAYELSGTVERFVDEMNDAMARSGMEGMSFSEPAGISAENRITAGAFADFLAHYVERFPWVIERYHALEALEFPDNEVYQSGPQMRPIVHANRNLLIGSYAGADGLKTGYIRASGYNIAATAERDGRRLITVVLGVDGADHRAGGERRAEEAADLLDFGFDAFVRADLRPKRIPAVAVVGGEPEHTGPEGTLPLRIDGATVLMAESDVERLRGRIVAADRVRAPANPGDIVGYVKYFVGEELAGWSAVRVRDSVDTAGGVFSRLRRAVATVRGVPETGAWTKGTK